MGAISTVSVSVGLLVVITLTVFSSAAADTNITSPATTDWGDWGDVVLCPSGHYAKAFQLKTEGKQNEHDDTALNGIRLFCGKPRLRSTAVITSKVGPWGDWSNVYSCPISITGFQLKVESPQGSNEDDTATNNVRFFCGSPDTDDRIEIEGAGGPWGLCSEAQFCGVNQAVCGIQTQVEDEQGREGDDTALNRVRLVCCDR